MTIWVLSFETTSSIKIISLKTTRACREIKAMLFLFKLKCGLSSLGPFQL